jgi:hypothetical protein
MAMVSCMLASNKTKVALPVEWRMAFEFKTVIHLRRKNDRILQI